MSEKILSITFVVFYSLPIIAMKQSQPVPKGKASKMTQRISTLEKTGSGFTKKSPSSSGEHEASGTPIVALSQSPRREELSKLREQVSKHEILINSWEVSLDETVRQESEKNLTLIKSALELAQKSEAEHERLSEERAQTARDYRQKEEELQEVTTQRNELKRKLKQHIKGSRVHNGAQSLPEM